MKFALTAAVATLVALAPATASAQEDVAAILAKGDAKKGERVFRRCVTCHAVGDNARNKVGPVQNDLIGRSAGTVEGYKYSKLNAAAGEAGLKWTEENLFAYLPDPTKFLKTWLTENGAKDQAKGRSKMVFKLRKADDRADVIAYLKTFSKPATN